MEMVTASGEARNQVKCDYYNENCNHGANTDIYDT